MDECAPHLVLHMAIKLSTDRQTVRQRDARRGELHFSEPPEAEELTK
jgi:hypothetical protein